MSEGPGGKNNPLGASASGPGHSAKPEPEVSALTGECPSRRRVRWFSDGAASAVATKFDIQEHGVEAGLVVICDTGAEDEDNYRFRAECQEWFGCEIAVIKSEKYDSTWDVWTKRRYMSGIAGAPCTGELKFVPRLNFERPNDIHVFGYTADPSDQKRAERLRADFPPMAGIVTPLIERGLTKANCLALLEGAGIAQPRTYAMGFPNANCLKSGCVKATSASYWALHRQCFPEGFAKTAALARELGVRLARLGEERVFIDDIPLDHPTTSPIAPTCDLLCNVSAKDLAA